MIERQGIDPGVPVQLDKERHLRFAMKAVRDIKENTGVNIMRDGFGYAVDEPDEMIKLLWYGLVWEDPQLTEDDVAQLFSLEKMRDILPLLAKAVGATPPEVDELGNAVEGSDDEPPLPSEL